jgi:hypothetical protein
MSTSRRSKREVQLAEDWQAIARTPEGRRIIEWMMGWGNVYQEIVENDPIALSRAVGENNFAKRIAFYLAVDLADFAASFAANTRVAREEFGMSDAEYRAQMQRFTN